jgi:hypothetical protein
MKEVVVLNLVLSVIWLKNSAGRIHRLKGSAVLVPIIFAIQIIFQSSTKVDR